MPFSFNYLSGNHRASKTPKQKMASSPSSSSSSSESDDLFQQEAILYDRMYFAVKRSLCARHFAGFASFEAGIGELSMLAAGASNRVQDPLFNCFPPPPEKVREEDWLRFEHWLMTEIGEPVRDLCSTWGFYGRCAIRTCEVCREASRTLGWDSGEEEDETETDGDSSDGGDGFVVGNEEVLDVINVESDEEVVPDEVAGSEAEAGGDAEEEPSGSEIDDPDANRKAKKPRL